MLKLTKYEKNSYVDGKKISEKGLSPVFIIKADSNNILRIETNYNINNLDLVVGKIDITKYITDISYEDVNGWITLIDSDFKVVLNRVKNEYNILLNLETNEFELENIYIIDESVKFEK